MTIYHASLFVKNYRDYCDEYSILRVVSYTYCSIFILVAR